MSFEGVWLARGRGEQMRGRRRGKLDGESGKRNSRIKAIRFGVVILGDLKRKIILSFSYFLFALSWNRLRKQF